jgi:hypothetical protein
VRVLERNDTINTAGERCISVQRNSIMS